MKTKFNFESQICTTREQSERLLALGLKKETADIVLLKEMVYDEENHCTRDGEGYLIRPIDVLYVVNYIHHVEINCTELTFLMQLQLKEMWADIIIKA